MAEFIAIQDCARCELPPVVSCDTKERGVHMYNLAHKCPGGAVARGARGVDRVAVIRQWNSEQISVALARVQMEAHNQYHE